MTTALMVSDAFARRMVEARAEFQRGVPIEAIRAVREPRFAAEAPSEAEKSVRERGYYTIAGQAGGGGALAIVPICGPIWAEESFWSRVFGGVTVPGLARAFAALERDAKVQRVLLEIDSPGGAAQEHEAISALKSLRAVKPVHAAACVDACSAAYWIACHADEIVAKPDSIIGSIGTRLAGSIWDLSAYMANEGIEAHGISTGKHKLTGEFGLPVDEEQLEHMRSICEGLFAIFGGDVAERRGVSIQTLRQMEGAVYVGVEAVNRGLADRVVESMDVLVRELVGMAPGVRAERQGVKLETPDRETPDEPSPDAPEPDDPIAQEQIMSTKNGTGAAPEKAGEKAGTEATGTQAAGTEARGASAPGPASFQELKALATRARLPAEAHAAFIVECQEKSLTVEAATDAAFTRMSDLLSKASATASDATKRAEQVQKNADVLAGEGTGVAPPVSANRSDVKSYEDLVVAYMAENECSLHIAMSKVARSNPAAHQKWIEADCPTIQAVEHA